MATSTVISGFRPQHRTARVMLDAFQGTVALDWANGQAVAAGSNSTAFDANNDRVVYVSVGGASTVVGCWIGVVASGGVSAAAAGTMWISQSAAPVPVYVPANQIIATATGGAGGTVSMIPALLAGS